MSSSIVSKLCFSTLKRICRSHGTRTKRNMIDASRGRLIIRYVPSEKVLDAQWAYVGRYLFYFVCQKLSFGDALRSFYSIKKRMTCNMKLLID